MPTVAVVEGWAVGGGLAIATACDFRIATPGTKFGVPIARTLGNCLSMANVARLVAAFGRPRVQRCCCWPRCCAEEALACGYVLDSWRRRGDRRGRAGAVRAPGRAGAGDAAVSKEALNRLLRHDLPDAEDLIRAHYGSEDFHEGVQAFVAGASSSHCAIPARAKPPMTNIQCVSSM
jgi:enoyl-CoA hydratase